MSNVKGPRFLKTKNGNRLNFIPKGTIINGAETIENIFIYTDGNKKYLSAKYEEKTGLPINHIEWGFLKKISTNELPLNESELGRIATAIAERNLFLLKTNHLQTKGSTPQSFAKAFKK